MKNIRFDTDLIHHCPGLVLGVIQCKITNTPNDEGLWATIREETRMLRGRLAIEEVKHQEAIMATRLAYKKCGKDPNRYRPSAEQLNRRILQGKDLYQISTAVDLINLVSLTSGFSIGGFDADNVKGDLVYGVGKAGEAYRGIGRGLLNIEGLPVLRDAVGGIGTPTSDEERTMLSVDTTCLLMNINAFNGKTPLLENTLSWSVELLKKHVHATDVEVNYFYGTRR